MAKGNNHGKKRTLIRRERAVIRQEAYEKLTLEEKIARAIPGTRQHKRLMGQAV
jgi:hypothetical protein